MLKNVFLAFLCT